MASTTVGTAISTLEGYFNTIAAVTSVADVSVYLGFPTGSVTDNYLMIGAWDSGEDVVLEYDSEWLGLPGVSGMVYGETYKINCNLRTYSRDTAPLDRINDAFTLYGAVRAQIQADPGGSGNLSPSGSWGRVRATMPTNGLINGSGWGVILAFEVEVINVRL